MSFGVKLLSEIARPDVERFIEDLLLTVSQTDSKSFPRLSLGDV